MSDISKRWDILLGNGGISHFISTSNKQIFQCLLHQAPSNLEVIVKTTLIVHILNYPFTSVAIFCVIRCRCRCRLTCSWSLNRKSTLTWTSIRTMNVNDIKINMSNTFSTKKPTKYADITWQKTLFLTHLSCFYDNKSIQILQY